MFMNSYVSLKSFHMFSTLFPEINMLGEISKHFRFMETHLVRNHVKVDSSQDVKAKCYFTMYLSYALQQWPEVILTKKSYY